jgi:hypothetical protein
MTSQTTIVGATQKERRPMNGRRGLYRVWIVFSVVWSIFGAYSFAWDHFVYQHAIVIHPGIIVAALPWIFAPWIWTAAVVGFRWVRQGFTQTRSSSAGDAANPVQESRP